jgi:DNA-binding response OmpR family regulator
MPFKSGITVCRELRAKGITTPIVIVTALDSAEDRSRGLEAGANGYLTKPFKLDDLLEQIARLTGPMAGMASAIQVADLEVDPIARIARRGGTEIPLTQREFQLLHLLAVNAGRVVSRQMICERIWKMEFDPQSNIIDSYVRFLQRKIDPRAEGAPMIHMVNGVGYRLSADP